MCATSPNDQYSAICHSTLSLFDLSFESARINDVLNIRQFLDSVLIKSVNNKTEDEKKFLRRSDNK